jgi:hypothetical protein
MFKEVDRGELTAVAEIQEIAANLERDPDAYVDLYPTIMRSYHQLSGGRSRGPRTIGRV